MIGAAAGSASPAPVRAFLGLGSNLGDRARTLRAAREWLSRHQVPIIRHSRVYESPPWGKTDQPPFLNQVVEVETTLSPHALLSLCHEVERALGRVRRERWGPRAIDVDILLYNDLVLATADLVVPHPEMRRRAFVLVPLAEIAPELRLPSGETVGALLTTLPDRSTVLAISHE